MMMNNPLSSSTASITACKTPPLSSPAVPGATASYSSAHGTSSAVFSGASPGFQLSRLRCRIHPSIVLSMLDAHDRLREPQKFAIGTLLGTVTSEAGVKGGGSVVVEVSDCFVNPYNLDVANHAVTIHKEQHEWMLKLKEKINPKLSVVGWCSTTDAISYTAAVNEWAHKEPKMSHFTHSRSLPEPINILIDPSFSQSQSVAAHIKAYTYGPLHMLMHEVPLEIVIHPSEAPAIASIIKSSTTQLQQQQQQHRSAAQQPVGYQECSENLSISMKKLQSVVDKCLEYVNRVLSGEIEGDPEIARTLIKTISLPSYLPREELEAIWETSVKDNLMILYLANLARLQLNIGEKLNTSGCEKDE